MEKSIHDKIANLKKLAERNDNNAQFELGQIYFYGKDGVGEDEKEAFYWFRKAAVNGHKEAYELLKDNADKKNGYAPIEYLYCLYETENKEELEKVTLLEGELSSLAKLFIGQLAFKKEDYKQAFQYLKQALISGYYEALDFIKEQSNNVYSQEALGEIYLEGLGVNKNTKEAFSWYARAKLNGSQTAEDILYKYANRGEADAIYYCAENLLREKKYKEFADLVKNGSEQGRILLNNLANCTDKAYEEVEFGLAEIYYQLNDYTNAISWYEKSFESGNKNALEKIKNHAEDNNLYFQYELAEIYYNGKLGIEKNIDTAKLLYKKSSEQSNGYIAKELLKAHRTAKTDNQYAQYALGKFYYNNNKTFEAFDLLIKSANQGNCDAIAFIKEFAANGDITKQYEMAKLIEQHNFSEQELLQPMALYESSANKGNIASIKELVNHFHDSKDKNKTSFWILKLEEESLKKGFIYSDTFLDDKIKYILGEIYFNDLRNPENKEKGLTYFMQSARSGYAKAKKIIETIDLKSLNDKELSLLNEYYNVSNVKLHLFIKKYKPILAMSALLIISLIIGFVIYLFIPKGTDYEKAEIYHNRGNIKKAHAYYEKHFIGEAETGNAETKYDLSQRYLTGDQVNQDYGKSIYWLAKSAEQGYPTAQYALGVYYYNEGTKTVFGDTSYKQAKYWFEKAAEQGYAEAQYELSVIYYEGIGENYDYKKAKYWFEKAIKHGTAEELYRIGAKCVSNEDYERAIPLLEKALKQGIEGAKTQLALAQCFLGIQYLNGDGVNENYTTAEQLLSNSLKLSDTYLAKLALGNAKTAIEAEKGDSTSQFILGDKYYKGTYPIQKNYRKAKYWLEKSARQGNWIAQGFLKTI